jgi:hypothetical protein
MNKLGQIFEQFKVHGKDLGDKIRELIHEGNVRRIIIKDEQGHTFMEIPLTVATVGVVLAPILVAVGAIATVVSRFDVVVERTGPPSEPPSSSSGSSKSAGSNIGATDNQVDMKDTVAQRVNSEGTKIEDIAGTGKHDSQGG